MKKLTRQLVGLGVMVWCGVSATAQPWSVTATNRVPQVRPPEANPIWTASPAAPAVVAPPTTPPPVVAPVTARPQPTLLANSPLPPGILAFDADQKEYTAKPGEMNCPFVFTVTNISPGNVSIRFIQTSCGCTTSRIQLPMNLAPGATGEIPINMNVAGKTGVVPKTVTVHTDQGHRVLVVRANIQPPAANPATEAMNRERNQQIAAADRQAVFKGDCAKCHVEPTVGKYGKDLYVAACGICHAAEHRATMVPDLHQLKVTPNAEYWRFFVVNGKPGTLMPAFSVPQGGPLTDPQIESLIGYLVKEFPRERTNAPAAAPAP